ncbi:hypothetical protein NQ317_001783 [Molorchus minor]|uniref:E3 ubiquitin-protein ligase LRSAM1 n=1 Tax=Molorchus minor TaxID=1323400 RepID=A0ABQ9IW50_9CUCU|nr:hypothetical protein NQ317_001783 [Molorchus minor]
MFRRNKHFNKAKLEHKLYLARENPEPVFDLSECYIRDIPSGVYSLCKVFLKESLRLEDNCLTSLSEGGQLKDLQLLKILNISNNSFTSLPDDIFLLNNLRELYMHNNQIKKLPNAICKLVNLKILDVSNNVLKSLPENIGHLVNLVYLNLLGNKQLRFLPKSICNAQRIMTLEANSENFVYPPSSVVKTGAESILRYICSDVGIPYSPEKEADIPPSESPGTEDVTDHFQQQRMQEFLEIERHNEVLHKQEFELANTSRANRDKLLAVLVEQQNQFESELTRIQQEKEIDRFRLIEQLQEAENNADIAIKKLLALNREPLTQLLERERQEEERLVTAINRYNEALRKDDILSAMEDILEQEAEKFKEFVQSRVETSKTILQLESDTGSKLLEVLQAQDEHKAELIIKLKEDSDLQRVAVGTLLERGDARSWGLLQQVKLVEAQLAALTHIEMDRKKLKLDRHMNDLAEKRINLSILLIDLLEQQKKRRNQLLSTLQTMELSNEDTIEDFWLKQYQRLLDKLPKGLSQAQKNIDINLAQILLMNGVILNTLQMMTY